MLVPMGDAHAGRARGLLLDVGGVLIRTPFELLDATERRLRLAPGALGPRGPFGLEEDRSFAAVLEGELAERRYWEQRAARAAELLDIPPETRSFIRVLFDADESQVVRSEVRALVTDAEEAGIPTGVLTNDLHAFHGSAWVESMAIFSRFDVLIDGSRTGELKPARTAYERAVEAMGLPADQLVLLDDQPTNVRGARAAGLQAVRFDPVDPTPAIRMVRELLGLRN